MDVIAQASDLLIRAAEEGDVPLLARWRSDPRVLAFYSGRDRPLDEEGVRRKYFGQGTDPSATKVEEYQACLVEQESNPVGFVQFYRLLEPELASFELPRDERVFGLDLFLGDPANWGHGLGTRVIGMTRDHLRGARRATRVVADPRVENPRSLRAFEKAGFRKTRFLPAHEAFEGRPCDCWLVESR